MGIQRGLWLAGLCFLGVTLAGCGPPATLFVETTVRPDGSCGRLIWQPKDRFLPKQALQPAWNSRWKSVVDASGPHGTSGAHAREKLTKFVVRTAEELAKAPPKASDTEGAFQYFIATGSFRSPLDIPPHYRFGGEKFPNGGTSELERSFERKDYGFVVEYRWMERITNNVTLTSFLRARDELLALMEPFAVDYIEKALGKEYDVSKLITFVHTNVRPFLEEGSIILFDVCSQFHKMKNQKALEAELATRFQDLAKRHLGLDISAEKWKQITAKEVDQKLLDQIADFLMRYVSRRDGQALTRPEMTALIRHLDNNANLPTPDPKLEKLLGEQVGLLILRMTGLYQFPLAFLGTGAPHYEFVLRLPGKTIETTGILLKSNETRWRFTAEQIPPDGHEMKARSILIDRDRQMKTLGRVAIDDAAKATEFIEAVGPDGPLLEAVRKLHQTGERNALRQVETRTFEESSRARKLRKMLFDE